MAVDKEALARRIRALLAKTVENGASEAEALAAAEKAGELMTRYEIEAGDLGIRAETCVKKVVSIGKSQRHPVEYAIPGIVNYTGTRCWMNGTNVTFFGLPHDAEIAAYLLDTFRAAMDAEWKRYLGTVAYRDAAWDSHPRTLRASFMRGITRRLNARLLELARERTKPAPSTGTALVVVKNAVVEEQYAALGMKLGAAKKASAVGSRDAFRAGHEAGGRIGINPGVGRSTHDRIGCA